MDVLLTLVPQILVETTMPSEVINHNLQGKKNTPIRKTKFEQFSSTNPALQKILEGKLKSEEVNHTQEVTRNK